MLTDMKMSPAEQKTEMPMAVAPKGPEYPYGLKLCLDAVALKKLGLDMLMVGTKIEIEAVGAVVGCSMDAYEYGEESKRIEIQIQQLSVTPDSEQEDQAEEKTAPMKMGRRSTVLADD